MNVMQILADTDPNYPDYPKSARCSSVSSTVVESANECISHVNKRLSGTAAAAAAAVKPSYY